MINEQQLGRGFPRKQVLQYSCFGVSTDCEKLISERTTPKVKTRMNRIKLTSLLLGIEMEIYPRGVCLSNLDYWLVNEGELGSFCNI